MPNILTLALLSGALIALFVSTRQWPLTVRAPIWLIGAALLTAATVLAFTDGARDGLLALAIDAVRTGWSRSALMDTIGGNGPVLDRNLAAMADILLIVAITLALLALIAFAPGEAVEYAIRPLLLIALGAAGGAMLALTAVALGLGGHLRDRVYAGVVQPADVIDGDTIRMGDVTLRLWGVDAPEYDRDSGDSPNAHNQICWIGNEGFNCGRESRDALARMVRGAMLVCSAPNGGRPHDAFGRPLVRCVAHGPGPPFDVAARMAALGYADVYRDRQAIRSCYIRLVLAAEAKRRGIWRATEMLSPYDWRNNEDARFAITHQDDGDPPHPMAPPPVASERCPR